MIAPTCWPSCVPLNLRYFRTRRKHHKEQNRRMRQMHTKRRASSMTKTPFSKPALCHRPPEERGGDQNVQRESTAAGRGAVRAFFGKAPRKRPSRTASSTPSQSSPIPPAAVESRGRNSEDEVLGGPDSEKSLKARTSDDHAFADLPRTHKSPDLRAEKREEVQDHQHRVILTNCGPLASGLDASGGSRASTCAVVGCAG